MIKENFLKINCAIDEVAKKYGKEKDDITLVAVSKKHSIEKIKEAFSLGQRDFGENFVQEAISKIITLNNTEINWHFIGRIQSNKTRQISENFDWVHTVDRIKIAERLSKHRPRYADDLNICIQVNVDFEDSKSGVSSKDLMDLCLAIKDLPKIKLRGLMCIPKIRFEHELQRKPFNEIKNLLVDLNENNFDMDTLSMGMTDDFKAAIQEGSTIIRIGTALFGSR